MNYSDLFSAALDELNAATQLQADNDRLDALYAQQVSIQMMEEIAAALSN